ncbi:transposase [candidate division NPL-UPA2 bacterium]|nr:transposase [candidate division NPL-UPA2 bacterium]
MKADPAKLKEIILRKAPRLKPEGVDAKIHKLKELANESAFVSVGAEANLIRMHTLIQILWTSNSQVIRYLKILKQAAKSIPGYQYLSTIPGIGPITGATILAEIGDISLFKNARQLTAYAGIDPSVRKSGQFTGTHNRMSKRGSPYLRTAFYLAAKAVIYSNWTRNPEAQAVLREFYEKKKAEGKKPKVALGAVMRKLVHYTYAVLRDKHPFTINGC